MSLVKSSGDTAMLWYVIEYIEMVDLLVDAVYSDGGFTMPGDDMEMVGDQEGGGWDVDEELELPPDLVSG